MRKYCVKHFTPQNNETIMRDAEGREKERASENSQFQYFEENIWNYFLMNNERLSIVISKLWDRSTNYFLFGFKYLLIKMTSHDWCNDWNTEMMKFYRFHSIFRTKYRCFQFSQRYLRRNHHIFGYSHNSHTHIRWAKLAERE